MVALLRTLRTAPLLARVRFAERRVSAMIRVRNEEQFLYASVRSIADHVDEIVLVDNRSTDRTPEVIERIRRELPSKTRVFAYPFEVCRVGEEHRRLAATPEGRRAPELLANYYNWCLERCREPFVLKWDADMLATREFHASLAAWRSSRGLMIWVHGVNVHADRRHRIARASEPEVGEDYNPFTSTECRLFPRWRARYDSGFWHCERLTSPFLRRRFTRHHALKMDRPGFVHLKFCKKDPYANLSEGFARHVRDGVGVGEVLEAEWRQLVASAES